MAGKTQIEWPSKADLEALLDDAGSVASAAARLDCSAPGLRHHLRKEDIEVPRPVWRRKLKKPPTAKPGTEVHGDVATVITEARADVDLGDLETLLRDRGLDPEQWEVDRAKLNEWDALARGGDDPEVVTLRQLTAHLKRKAPLHWLFPAADVKQRPAPKRAHDPEKPQVVVFVPDQHCPYIDREAEKRVLALLHDVQPDRIVNLGDVCDFPTISRHNDNPAYFASARECVQSGFEHLAAQRDACPDAEIDVIEGNHDARPRTELLARAERMYGLKPAEIPGEGPQESPWSLRTLLHLDRLHIRLVGPELEGDHYMHGLLMVSDDLAAVHGFFTGKSSVENTMDRLGMSVVFGHTHHQSAVEKLIYRGNLPVERRFGIQAGTLRVVPGGGGFAKNPDWHLGCVATTMWPGGGFAYDMARVELDGRLYYQGRRF